MKAENNFILNSLAIFQLCITPVICLYKSHNYPLLSSAFLFFTLMSLLVTLLLVWFCRFSIFRFIIFALGITVLVRFLSGSLLRDSLVTVYLIVALASLIVLLLKDEITRVIIASTMVIILSSFVAIEKNYPHYVINKSEEPQMQGSKNRNPVFHFVFDEAAGISSLSLAGKQGEAALDKLVNVLAKHGFTSVRDAHSSSMWSSLSLGHIINLEEINEVRGEGQNFYYIFNPLFELLNKNGYKINVFQSSHLDFCSSAKSYIRSCYEYPINSLSYFDDNGLNQLSLVVPATLNQFKILHWFNRHMPKSAVSEYLGFHQRMPLHFGSLSQLSVQTDFVAKLEEDLNSKDQYYFVHFLYPHHSYYQESDCKIKSRFSDWGNIGNWGDNIAKTQELRIQSDERQVLYQAYFEQFECFTKVLDSLLNKVLDAYPDAILILHGDHSSRISTRHIKDYSTVGFPHLDQQNFSDLYSTLLAVKYPGNVPGIMDCRISLVEFAQHFFRGQVGEMGEKTKIIANRLFADSDECFDQLLPPLF